MTLAALGLGSNREPRRHLEAGLQALEAHYGKLVLSEVFESEPVGFRGPNFINLVVSLETSGTLAEMLHFLKG
ncbi:MAG: 2-amino-4-hydroxy-6-hydroxymethyldihydropteridine diphosphokinase, partial [Pseudomonas sp.]